LEKYKKLLLLKQKLGGQNPRQQQQQQQGTSEQLTPRQSDNQSNDSEKIQRIKSLLHQESNKDEAQTNQHWSTSSSTMTHLNDEFKKALFELENKFADFERNVDGKVVNHQQQTNSAVVFQSSQSQQQQKQTTSSSNLQSFSSSYTMTLIKIVSSLLDYLREACVELNFEKMKQVELNKQLEIHRKLIDGLTNEILSVKEQNEKILNDCVAQNSKIEAELDHIKVQIWSILF
jgi:hypothetical protein